MKFTRLWAGAASLLALAAALSMSSEAQTLRKPVQPLKPSPVRLELRKLNLKPDLVIKKLRLKSYGPCKPRRAVLTFEVVIANVGDAPASGIGGAGIVKVAENNGAGPWAGGAGLGRSIPPGGTVTMSVPVYYLQSNPGHMVSGAPHRFRAEADPLKRIAEKNENNNRSATVRVGAPPDCPGADRPRIGGNRDLGPVLKRNRRPQPGLPARPALMRPDLVVGQIRVAQGCEVNGLGLRIFNLGNGGVPDSAYETAGGAAIRIQLDGRPWGRLRLREADSRKLLRRPRSRAAGHEVRLPARRLEVGAHRVAVTVDSNNSVGESNERNNTSVERIYCRIEPDPDGLSPGG